MFIFLRRFMKDERGQAIAEMAIALPVLLTLLCGIIDFGWLFTNQLTLSYCSREGARYGIVNPDGTDAAQDITDRVLSIAPDYIRDKMSVLVTFSDEPSRREGDVSVDIEANVSVLTPVAGIFAQGDTITLTSKCVMKVE